MASRNIQPKPGDIQSRVGHLEGAVESLAHEVQETNRNLKDFSQETGRSVKELSVSMARFKDDVLGHIGKATAPKWPLIVSIGSLALTILGLGGTIVAMIMSGQSGQISKLEGRLEACTDKYHQQALISSFEDGKSAAWREQVANAIAVLE